MSCILTPDLWHKVSVSKEATAKISPLGAQATTLIGCDNWLPENKFLPVLKSHNLNRQSSPPAKHCKKNQIIDSRFHVQFSIKEATAFCYYFCAFQQIELAKYIRTAIFCSRKGKLWFNFRTLFTINRYGLTQLPETIIPSMLNATVVTVAPGWAFQRRAWRPSVNERA